MNVEENFKEEHFDEYVLVDNDLVDNDLDNGMSVDSINNQEIEKDFIWISTVDNNDQLTNIWDINKSDTIILFSQKFFFQNLINNISKKKAFIQLGIDFPRQDYFINNDKILESQITLNKFTQYLPNNQIIPAIMCSTQAVLADPYQSVFHFCQKQDNLHLVDNHSRLVVDWSLSPKYSECHVTKKLSLVNITDVEILTKNTINLNLTCPLNVNNDIICEISKK